MKKFYFLTIFLFTALLINAQTSVTFAVDMNGVAEFDPGTDEMKLGGSFQGWSPDDTVLEDPDGNGVYAVTVDVDPGDISWKYVINAWETNEFHPDTPGTPGDCTMDDGAGNINRIATIPDQATFMIPIYLYNTCDESTLGITGIRNLTTINDIKITPNPASDLATVTFSNPNNVAHQVTLSTLTGQTLSQFNDVRNTLEINTQNLAAGMYFVTFQNEKGEVGSKKLIVQ